MSITDFDASLRQDHLETKAHLQTLASLMVNSPDLESIRKVSQQLSLELKIHFACEEQALFPALSLYRTMILMEVEHDNLLKAEHQYFEVMETPQAFQDGHPSLPLKNAFEQFQEELLAHMKEEEEGVFALAHQCLEPEEKALVQRKLEECRSQLTQSPGKARLSRPKPAFKVSETGILKTPMKPLSYQKCFEVDHAGLYHLYLKSGQGLKAHWSGEHQCLVVLNGKVEFQTDSQTQVLERGMQLQVEPRLKFSLKALEDSHLINMKVWPHPHFIRSS